MSLKCPVLILKRMNPQDNKNKKVSGDSSPTRDNGSKIEQKRGKDLYKL